MYSSYFKILLVFVIVGFVIACTKDETPKVGSSNKVSLKTSDMTFIGIDSAIGGGEIINDGGDAITERGVCWGTSSDPTISQNSIASGTGNGSYISVLRNLTPNTTYFVRAYIMNAQGTIYANQLSFKTKAGPPTLQTNAATSIKQVSAITGGSNINDRGSAITQKGICWSQTNTNPSLSDSKVLAGSGISNFSTTLSNLAPSSTYYIRAYAINANGTGYGNTVQFKTLDAVIPTLTTNSIISIGQTIASGGGSISNDGGAPVTQRGVCWSTFSNPTIYDNRTIDGSGTGSFTSQMTSLLPNRTYYVRSYATNSVGISYGQQVAFTTLSLQLPTISTSSINSITNNSARGGGSISNDGGAPVTQRGVCWSTFSNPTIYDNRTIDGSGTGSFTSQMTSLLPNRTYYVRSYATNSVGISYGQQVAFTTLSLQLPTISTSSINSITNNSARGGGSISNDGGAPVTQRGVCWSTFSNPTIYDNRTIDGSGTGSFTSQMTSLLPNRTYYVRSYATNSVGISYGPQIQFATLSGLPTVTSTTSPYNHTQTTVWSGGYISSDGGSPITARGVCWSLSPNPTIYDNKTVDGSGTGSFSSYINKNYSYSSWYYIRAYATNANGTTYGPEIRY